MTVAVPEASSSALEAYAADNGDAALGTPTDDGYGDRTTHRAAMIRAHLDALDIRGDVYVVRSADGHRFVVELDELALERAAAGMVGRVA